MLALLLRNAFAQMVPDHGRVPAVQCGIVRRTAKHFGNELRDVLEVFFGHGGKERRNYRIRRDLFVEKANQLRQYFAAAKP